MYADIQQAGAGFGAATMRGASGRKGFIQGFVLWVAFVPGGHEIDSRRPCVQCGPRDFHIEVSGLPQTVGRRGSISRKIRRVYGDVRES